jgi:hypothetical protein
VVLAAAVGNIIEWYDFYIFGSLATILSVQFFEKSHPKPRASGRGASRWLGLRAWGTGTRAVSATAQNDPGPPADARRSRTCRSPA